MEDNKKELRNNTVYAYVFEETKVAYIGRTVDAKRRNYNHRTNITNTDRKYVYNSPVYVYATEHNIEIPEMRILDKNLNAKDSLIREDYWMSHFSSNGYVLLNKRPSGIFSGAISNEYYERYSDENLKEISAMFGSMVEFKVKLPNLYKNLKNNNMLDKLSLPEFPEMKKIEDESSSETNSGRDFANLAKRLNIIFNLENEKKKNT